EGRTLFEAVRPARVRQGARHFSLLDDDEKRLLIHLLSKVRMSVQDPREAKETRMARGRLTGPFLLAASLTLAACAAPAPGGSSSQNQAPAQETPQYGGLFHLPARVNFDGKDPMKGTGGSQLGLKARPAYEPLVAYKAEPGTNFRRVREVVPWLAEKWEQP